jgi:16S rRNA (guanine527-N7)-methyltransferase
LSAALSPSVDRPSLSAALEAAVASLGLPVPSAKREQLLDYLELLVRWNRTYNLTAVRDPAEMLSHHIVDSLAALPAVFRWRTKGRVLDVGSGGGLPGAIWAIAAASLDVTCVDSVGKKAAFVRQVATQLHLSNLHSVHARVETVEAAAFDLVVSRAFASLADFVAASEHALAPGGVWLAMKGKLPRQEIAALPRGVEVFHVEPLVVPGLNADRCLVLMRPTTPFRGKASNKSVRKQTTDPERLE